MRSVLTFLVAALAPSAASAVLTVHVEQRVIPATGTGGDQVVLLDVYADDPGGGEDRLQTFSFGINLLSPVQPGVRFLPAVYLPLSLPYVFRDYTGSEPTVATASDTRLVIAAATSGGQAVNIGDGPIGLASIPVFVPSGFNGLSAVAFDPFSATFAGPGGPLPFVPGDVGGVMTLPEPSAPAFGVAVSGLMLYRRRRHP
jgi:hypothetical protein